MSTITNRSFFGSWTVPAAAMGLLLVAFMLMVVVGTAQKMTDDALFASKLEQATKACAKEGAVPLITFAVPQPGDLSPKKQIVCAAK